jgi:hypothetical protein
MTHQEILNKVWARLKAQGRAARNDYGGCAYRTSDGSRCAVGILFDNPSTLSFIEASGLNCQPVEKLVKCSYLDEVGEVQALAPHVEFLTDLQEAHDEAGKYNSFLVELWDNLFQVAAKWELDMPPTSGENV